MYHQLKSKIQEVTVTESNESYEGSITIDETLMVAANIRAFEQVHVNGKSNGSRIITYVIPGKAGSGIIALNGGASHHFKVGDKIHILSFRLANISELPVIIHADQNNQFLRAGRL